MGAPTEALGFMLDLASSVAAVNGLRIRKGSEFSKFVARRPPAKKPRACLAMSTMAGRGESGACAGDGVGARAVGGRSNRGRALWRGGCRRRAPASLCVSDAPACVFLCCARLRRLVFATPRRALSPPQPYNAARLRCSAADCAQRWAPAAPLSWCRGPGIRGGGIQRAPAARSAAR